MRVKLKAGQARKKNESVGRKGQQKAARFFAENEGAISDYAQQAGFSFEPGDRWSFDMKSCCGTYDTDYFVSRGYTFAESMWATCHEIEHFRDWRKDPEAYEVLYRKAASERRLGLLYHYINDIMVNREEDGRFPAHRETRDFLYVTKLLPRIDYTKAPRHIQFITAMLREKVLPRERLTLSDEVRETLEKLKNIDGQGTDLINLVTDPTALPGERFLVIRDYIEPLYEGFFQEDLKKRKKEETQKAEKERGSLKEESMEGGSRQTLKGHMERDRVTNEDYFLREYDASEELFPQVLSPNEARDEIEQEIRRRKEEGKAPDLMAREQFKFLHRVSAEEMEDYSDDCKKIENNIDPLRGIFERVIASRKEIRRRLKERTDQGVVIDPSMLSQAYIDIQSGIVNSRTQLKVCREEFDEHQLKDFEFTLICDLSGSMNENWPGGKSYEQRLSTILIIEALDEFEKQLKNERQSGLIDLHVFTEVRGFCGDDVELKPLGDSIDFQRRVAISRRLEDCTGNSTADYKTLAEVAAKISHDTEQRIERGELRKVLLLLTDGGSDNVALARAAREQLNRKGVIGRAIQIGQQRKEETERFKYVWQRDGTHCRNVSRLVRAINKLLEGFLQNL
jgi:hypothetical protein